MVVSSLRHGGGRGGKGIACWTRCLQSIWPQRWRDIYIYNNDSRSLVIFFFSLTRVKCVSPYRCSALSRRRRGEGGRRGCSKERYTYDFVILSSPLRSRPFNAQRHLYFAPKRALLPVSRRRDERIVEETLPRRGPLIVRRIFGFTLDLMWSILGTGNFRIFARGNLS